MAAINVFPEQVAVDSSTGETITFSKGNPPPVSASRASTRKMLAGMIKQYVTR
jgi:hypothetical protein